MVASPEFVKLAYSGIAKNSRAIATGNVDLAMVACALAALLCIIAPLEITQLLCLLTGAAWYALMQAMQKPAVKASKCCADISEPPKVLKQTKNPSRQKGIVDQMPSSCTAQRSKAKAPTQQVKETLASRAPDKVKASVNEMPKLTPSMAPVSAPSFQTTDFGAQVHEILDQIAPKPDGERIVQILTNHVKTILQELIPEIEVMGFVSGDFTRAQAYGVAVPEVDIVANISPAILVQSLKGRLSRGAAVTGKPYENLEARKLQKSGIREMTDVLVAKGGFKFRRSAFRGEEPKVTLLSPSCIVDHPFPLDFSVNCVTPLYNAALITECGQIDARARELILLVKRWAKDRGICHAPKGHLHPYAWSLLAIYYLQVGEIEDGPLLPPLEGFQASSGLIAKKMRVVAAEKDAAASGESAEKLQGRDLIRTGAITWQPKTTIAGLFKGFLHFYNTQMNWRKECVSVLTGHRAPPDLSMDIHIIVRDNGHTEVAPCIEDPFNAKRNLGAAMTALSYDRFHEELDRGDKLCQREASLTEILEPWKPPETNNEETEDTRMKHGDMKCSSPDDEEE